MGLHLKSTNKSWRVEDLLKIKERRCYLYRAIDSAGATIDFLLSAFRDADAAERLFRQALSAATRHQYGPGSDLRLAITEIKKKGTLGCRCRIGPCST
jgi:hypothetical protein